MTQTEILWCVVTGAAVLLVTVHAMVHALRRGKSGHMPLLGMGRERDIFFIPGDEDDDDEDRD